MQKEYNYVLYYPTGEKTVGNISAKNADIAKATLNSMVNVREDVQFAILKEVDYPNEYDWDENLQMWQARML